MRSTIREALKLAALLRPTWPAIDAAILRSGAPTAHVAEGSLQEKLQRIETALSEAREDRAHLARTRDRTREAFARSPDLSIDSRQFKEAKAAREELDAKDAEIGALTEAQVETLRMLGRALAATLHGEGAASTTVPAPATSAVRAGRTSRAS